MGVKMAIYWDTAWVYNKNIWISLNCDPKFLYQSGYRNWSVDIETKEKHTAFVQKMMKESTTWFLRPAFHWSCLQLYFFCICKVRQLKIMVFVRLSAVKLEYFNWLTEIISSEVIHQYTDRRGEETGINEAF